jgi:hypothetical protein
MKLKVIEDIKKKIEIWKADKSLIDKKVKESWVMGNSEAAESFIKIQGELTKKIEDLVRKNIKDKEELSQEYEKREKENKEQATKTLKEVNDAHDDQCKYCRQGMENERLRFKARQMYLAEIINKIELLHQKMKQHSRNQIKLAETIVSASTQLASSKTDYVSFEDDLDTIIKEAAPYLNMKLADGTTDFFIQLDKTLDSHIMIDAPKQVDKKDKKDGGLV